MWLLSDRLDGSYTRARVLKYERWTMAFDESTFRTYGIGGEIGTESVTEAAVCSAITSRSDSTFTSHTGAID